MSSCVSSLQSMAAGSYLPTLRQILAKEWKRQVWDQRSPSEGMLPAAGYTFYADWETAAIYHLPGVPADVGEHLAVSRNTPPPPPKAHSSAKEDAPPTAFQPTPDSRQAERDRPHARHRSPPRVFWSDFCLFAL